MLETTIFGQICPPSIRCGTGRSHRSSILEQLSDSIAMTKQMLDATADSVGALDTYNREMGNYELLSEVNR